MPWRHGMTSWRNCVWKLAWSLVCTYMLWTDVICSFESKSLHQLSSLSFHKGHKTLVILLVGCAVQSDIRKIVNPPEHIAQLLRHYEAINIKAVLSGWRVSKLLWSQAPVKARFVCLHHWPLPSHLYHKQRASMTLLWTPFVGHGPAEKLRELRIWHDLTGMRWGCWVFLVSPQNLRAPLRWLGSF